ncbi:MAG: serine dehydratase subunit alpha family protein [Deltaproteobacteria bacterium]|jgi:L-cysteine desulfidase|nr:serine dehydratase subunit alpha family protein [Deltaproteobacteria bacterium]
MNIFKAVLEHEVFPALGCTEPIAVAYAAGLAGNQLDADFEEMTIAVDPGVYKNGLAVHVPNTGGERGNLIAGVLGALIRRPDLKMEILKAVDSGHIPHARSLIESGNARILCYRQATGMHIDVKVRRGSETARAVIRHRHTNLVLLEKNGRPVFQGDDETDRQVLSGYQSTLSRMRIVDLIRAAENIDDADRHYLREGVEMNLKMAEAGKDLKKVGYYLSDLIQKGFFHDDILSSSKIMTSSAADARMAGVNHPVMASGGSGNQGIVAILVPYHVGQYFDIPEDRIVESIALSHLLNSYVKCFTGSLSPLCGCAIAAGVGASAAIVYQQSGAHMDRITLAINNIISDLGGMLCDGAKGGCSLKVVSATDSAIRSAYMALNDYGITAVEGFVGKTAEETIYNLGRISEIGMAKADDVMLDIMTEKISPAPETDVS